MTGYWSESRDSIFNLGFLIYVWLWSFVVLLFTKRRLNTWLMGSNPAKMFCFYKAEQANQGDIVLWKQKSEHSQKILHWSLGPFIAQLVFLPLFPISFWPNTWWENLLLPTNPPHPSPWTIFTSVLFPPLWNKHAHNSLLPELFIYTHMHRPVGVSHWGKVSLITE